ncbi:MAG: class I SAM-dependent methyltransferase [Actinomycetota bacterium]
MSRALGPLRRAVGAYFSYAATHFYDRVTVNRVFPLLGGELNDLVLRQGRRAVAAAAGGPILDMPVGTAYFASELALAHDGVVIGVDLAEGMVKKAKHVADERGAANLLMARGDAHRLPFPDDSFSVILCTNGLPVIPGLADTLAELYRVIAPGGTLFVSAITLPVGAVLPSPAAARLPAGFRSGRGLLQALEDAGFNATLVKQARLAKLFEATKHSGLLS